MTTPRKLLVTTALPYANGDIHLGHLVEHVQTDIWVRWQKLLGNDVLYICGDDAHGTPIMLSAEKQGVTPEVLIEKVFKNHLRDFSAFNIEYDNYYTTHSPENRDYSAKIYLALKARGDISTKTIAQAYDAEKNMFLPDRYVKGTCPRCKAADQYGDNCESCGATYMPTELIDPVSTLSGTTPIQKESVHYFFELANHEDMLKKWVNDGHLQPQVANKLAEWFEVGLRPWDISRDAPYFGIEIPDTENKYFYVWVDAPVGYMASFENLCQRRDGINFDDYWGADSKVELYHFVGKDIIYFHALFWPAMLTGAGYRTPNAIYAHGFLTVDGKKMSKSRGTFINAQTYLKHLSPDYLRYYLAAKLTSTIDDIDLNFNDFTTRINSDMVGKIVNIASRSATFINKHFEGKLASECHNPDLFQQFIAEGEAIADFFIAREYGRGIREVAALADKANQYIDEHKPWELIKADDTKVMAHQVCTMCLNLFKLIMTYIKPVVPSTVENAEKFMNIEFTWDNRETFLSDHSINTYEPLMTRIHPDTIAALKKDAASEIDKDVK